MEALPAVAKSFSYECKKCGTERYHRVLTHVSTTSAKIECEICHSKKTYKLPSAQTARKKPNTSGLEKARAQKGKAAAEAMLKAHQSEYEKMLGEAEGEQANYSFKLKFSNQQKVQHPQFGLGVVRTAYPDRIEVVFPDEVRKLVHNRG